MSFWDSSALLPLSVDEPASTLMQQISQTHGVGVVWWGSLVECHSAFERRTRAGQWTLPEKRQALRILHQLAGDWSEIQPVSDLCERALRLLAAHSLRAADALQLAAALLWAAERPAGRVFVCLDDRLREAAEQEGFTVLPDHAS